MATEMITVKMDGKFLNQIDSIVKVQGYKNRTEFIRSALREKIDDARLKEAMLRIAHLRGAVGKKTSLKEYEKIRKAGFKEFL